MILPKLRWQISRMSRWLSPPGFLAIGITGLALCILIAAGAKSYRAEVEPDSVGRSVTATASPDTDEQRAVAFYSHLPARDQFEEQLARLFRTAARHGLVLKQGEYRTVADPAGRFVRVRIGLPVQGDYLAVQSFVAEALYEIPTLTVESVSFKRETTRSGATDTRLQLALLMQGGR
jgi:hypothetical protein